MAGPGFQLVMHNGPNQGKVAPLEKNEIFIGRDMSNDIVINDAEISRRHARLVLQAGGYVLEDLGSTNGTAVNGQRLMGPYILRPGDILTLGEHVTLGFEPAVFDPDATIAAVAARPAVNPPQVPPPSGMPPVSAPPLSRSAPPAFAGQVPSNPVMEYAAPPVRRRSPAMVVGIVAASLLAVACVCGAVLWFIDANLLWCTVFPFLSGCP